MIGIMASTKKQGSHGRRKPFHVQYLDLCKGKNLLPDPDVRVKNKQSGTLDFFGDRVKTEHWLSIFDSIYQDTSLRYVAIKLRKPANNVFEHLNSLKKTKTLEKAPFLLSSFIFSRFVDSMANFVSITPTLETLALEGLPLRGSYLASFIKGLSQNQTIKTLSLARSTIGDEACETICGIVKSLSSIENLNFSQCQLGPRGAAAVASVIKYQKITRYSLGWEKTLRYRWIDPDMLAGLKNLHLNGNAIGDEGLQFIMEEMKDDVWIKTLEIRECGLTDEAARHIIDCLNYNTEVLMIDVHGNPEMSTLLLDHIRKQMGMVLEKSDESAGTESEKTDLNDPVKLKKRVELLNQQLEAEMFLRTKTEELHGRLHQQLIEFQRQLNSASSGGVPEGCTVVEMKVLENLYKECDELRFKIAQASLPQPAKPQVDPPKPIKKRASILQKSKSESTPKPIQKRGSILHKTKSESTPKPRKSTPKPRKSFKTKSEQQIRPPGRPGIPQKKQPQSSIYVEKRIGDTRQKVSPNLQSETTTEQATVVDDTDIAGSIAKLFKFFTAPQPIVQNVQNIQNNVVIIDPSALDSSKDNEDTIMAEPERGSYVEEIFDEENSEDDHTIIAPI